MVYIRSYNSRSRSRGRSRTPRRRSYSTSRGVVTPPRSSPVAYAARRVARYGANYLANFASQRVRSAVRNYVNNYRAGSAPPFRPPSSARSASAMSVSTARSSNGNRRVRFASHNASSYYNPSKPPKGGFKQLAQTKGFSIHVERGGVVTDPYCVYIGHGTCPHVIMRRLFLGSLLKMLLRRMGLSFSNCNQPINYLTAGDAINIKLRRDMVTSGETTITYTLVGAQPNFQALLDAFVNAWVVAIQGFPAPDNNSSYYKLVEINFNPNGTGDLTAVRIPLENAFMEFEAVSSLKIQNRSVPADLDDTTDEVDRVPLRGMIYRFDGMGTNFKRTALAAIGETNFEPIGDRQDGLFFYSANSGTTPTVSLREPPQPFNFIGTKGYNKVYAEPGQINYSTLKYKAKLNIQNVVKYLIGANELTSEYFKKELKRYGKFNLLSLEKVMETTYETTPTQLVTVGYESDYKVFGFIVAKNVDSTIGEHYVGAPAPG